MSRDIIAERLKRVEARLAAGRAAPALRDRFSTDRVYNEGYAAGSTGFFAVRAEGPWLEDPTGERLLDTGMAAGSMLLGHAHPVPTEAIRRQAAQGTILVAANPSAYELAEHLAAALPWFDGFAFCNSGAEATMRAMRVARAVTGRRLVAVFAGGWHGGHDLALIEDDPASPPSAPVAMRKSAGTLGAQLDHLLLLPYNDPAAFDLIRAHGDELAMVLAEPAQGSNPRDDVGPFLRELAETTRSVGALFGTDEIITGFRLGLQGGQGFFGIEADIATYGKIVGGGLPVGVVAGRRAVMDRIRRGDAVDPLPVFMGGTFSANPLTMTAGAAVLGLLRAEAGTLYPALERKGRTVRDAVNDYCRAEGLRARMIGAGSVFRLLFTDKPVRSRRERDMLEAGSDVQQPFYACMLDAGVHVGSNRINFLSAAHDDAQTARIRDAYLETLALFHAADLL
jgi:glutamate-1-semialdehyde 2,1-aminomutase